MVALRLPQLMVKMVDQAVAARSKVLVAQELPGKVTQVAQQVQPLLHQAVVAVRALLVLLAFQARPVLAAQVVPTPLRDQALHTLVVEAGAHRATSLLAQVEQAVVVQVEQTALLAQQERQIREEAAGRQVQTAATHPELAAQVSSS